MRKIHILDIDFPTIRKGSQRPIHVCIKSEATKKELVFSESLKDYDAKPNVLIAGCGTGNQVIMASRYKDAKITAIDLSSSSLAYATRKAKEYGMDNVTFKRMDLLNIANLNEKFDIIECSGVLHHMEKPSDGLLKLVNVLKKGGYIKLGLYSKFARRGIDEARDRIRKKRINSTPDEIRVFREKVLNGEIPELENLPRFAADFYSLSECRDLCFHVKEHHFTTESLQTLLGSHDLDFCGFILPSSIKEKYIQRHSEDSDMTSLRNWGVFESKYPSTFASMYQFWARK